MLLMPRNRQVLEQLRSYITCPALASERVQCDAAGQVGLKLKTPLAFMQRPAALVPRPRLHLAASRTQAAAPRPLPATNERRYTYPHG